MANRELARGMCTHGLPVAFPPAELFSSWGRLKGQIVHSQRGLSFSFKTLSTAGEISPFPYKKPTQVPSHAPQVIWRRDTGGLLGPESGQMESLTSQVPSFSVPHAQRRHLQLYWEPMQMHGPNPRDREGTEATLSSDHKLCGASASS